MFSAIRSRLLCAAPAMETGTFTRMNGAEFVGRVGTQSNPRSLAPVITSNVLNGDRTISFTCISRNAAAKAIHAASLANTKNSAKEMGAFFKATIATDLDMKVGDEIGKGLTPFRITLFPSPRPVASPESSRFLRRTKVSASVDHEELAKNIHMSYLKKTPLVLECMGDKAIGIITQSIALFNERVKSHDMVSFVQIISGTSKEGTDIVKMEFQLFEEPKNLH